MAMLRFAVPQNNPLGIGDVLINRISMK